MGCLVGEDTCVINISVETIYKALQEFKAVQKTAKKVLLTNPQKICCFVYTIKFKSKLNSVGATK